jgi:hypothetical protein
VRPWAAFLPRAAEELYAVMTDTERGACASAIDREGRLIDPTVDETKEAIKPSCRRAAKDKASLFIADIGHGEMVKKDFYLLPRDADRYADPDAEVDLVLVVSQI